jgi:hypothetical protein
MALPDPLNLLRFPWNNVRWTRPELMVSIDTFIFYGRPGSLEMWWENGFLL